MRYILGVLTVSVAVVAIYLIGSGGSGIATKVAAPVAAPTIAPIATALPRNPVSSERAIAIGRSQAKLLGDPDATLIGIEQMTLAEADKRNHPGDEQGTRAGKSAIPDDAPVWRVLMRGSFTPPRVFYDEEGNPYRLEPKPGWAFVLIDPETSRIVGYGFKPGSPPGP
jgi:hypothetical protein